MMYHGPTVILAAFENVDFVTAAWTVKTTWAVLGFPQQICSRLEINPLSVAISISPNLRPRIRLADKRIVVRDGPIVVQAQSFSRQ